MFFREFFHEINEVDLVTHCHQPQMPSNVLSRIAPPKAFFPLVVCVQGCDGQLPSVAAGVI